MLMSQPCLSSANRPEKIAEALRSAVARGELVAGERLPVRTELETKFAASLMTVQKAMDTLTRDGFILSRGTLGTFVADHPPCLNRYGIVFSSSPHSPDWGGYREALLQVGHKRDEAADRDMAFYYGVDHEGDGDYESLLADIQSQRLAGILFDYGSSHTLNAPIVQQDRVPCMAVMSPTQDPSLEHVATIVMDGESLAEAAIGVLVGKGCRRPATLLGLSRSDDVQRQRHALAKFDLPYDSAMLQSVALGCVQMAGNVTALWMRLPEDERPDGLFIADDNLVEWACSGLLHAGIRPGIDIPVAAHCNFPARAGSGMPIDRVGFNIRALIQKFIDTTDARRRGEPFARHSTLGAVRESELDATVSRDEE